MTCERATDKITMVDDFDEKLKDWQTGLSHHVWTFARSATGYLSGLESSELGWLSTQATLGFMTFPSYRVLTPSPNRASLNYNFVPVLQSPCGNS